MTPLQPRQKALQTLYHLLRLRLQPHQLRLNLLFQVAATKTRLPSWLRLASMSNEYESFIHIPSNVW